MSNFSYGNYGSKNVLTERVNDCVSSLNVTNMKPRGSVSTPSIVSKRKFKISISGRVVSDVTEVE